jgi:hypothetical protein
MDTTLCSPVKCHLSFGSADNTIRHTQSAARQAVRMGNRAGTSGALAPFQYPRFDPKSLASRHILRRFHTQVCISFLVVSHSIVVRKHTGAVKSSKEKVS